MKVEILPVAAFASIIFVAPSFAATRTVGWPETIQLLVQERTQAGTCVGLLKSSGNKDEIMSGRSVYGTAKSLTDGVIAGLTTVLVEGGRPESLANFQSSLKEAGVGLQKICDMAVKSASTVTGTKGVVVDMAKAAIEPLINTLSAAFGALWTQHIQSDKLKLETIRTQLDAAKWVDFGEIAPAL